MDLFRWRIVAALGFLAACSPAAPDDRAAVSKGGTVVHPSPPSTVATKAVQPEAQSVSADPLPDRSPEAAAEVVRSYFAAVSGRRYADALALRSGEESAAAFTSRFAGYRDYRAEVGVPDVPEGAAGSTYIDVPVRIRAQRDDGRAVDQAATVTLRHVNDVPGATARQRRWHIERIAPESGAP